MAEDMRRYSRRVSYQQLEKMWNLLSKNRSIALGYNRSIKDKDKSRRVWAKIGKVLNTYEDGCIKSAGDWRKYWIDYKAKLKKSLIKQGTGQGKELTEIEIKYLQLLENDAPAEEGAENGDNAESSDGISTPEPEKEFKPMMANRIKIDSDDSLPSPLPAQTVVSSPPPDFQRRRRRFRPENPVNSSAAFKALVRGSDRKIKIEEKRNVILDTRLQQLVQAVQELTETIKSRFPERPSGCE